MTDFKKNSHDTDNWDKLDFSNNTRKNQRIGVRYVRDDIAASVCKISSFSFGFLFNKEMLVELVDISSKGVLIATDKKLKVNKKITLTLTFEDSRSFTVKAKVVRKAQSHGNHQYGIKFDRLNNELGDYLLATQRKLVFK
jgi:hypothetical protein